MFIRKIRMVLHFHTKTTHSPCSPKNNKSPPKTSEVGHKFLSVLQTTAQSLRNTDHCCNQIAHLHKNCQCLCCMNLYEQEIPGEMKTNEMKNLRKFMVSFCPLACGFVGRSVGWSILDHPYITSTCFWTYSDPPTLSA